MNTRVGTALSILVLATGCSSSTAKPGQDASAQPGDTGAVVDSGGSSDAGTIDSGAVDAGTFDAAPPPLDAAGIVAARPYTLHVPSSYDASVPMPLVIMFHGYGATGALQEIYFNLTAASDAHGFLYAYGDGTLDTAGKRFWNATDACCDTYHTGVDDVQYFDAILADVSSKENVDPKRVFVIGHSNGGFMSHRLACDRTHKVAAILALAGDVYLDATKCSPSEKVSIAQVHGNADLTIGYDGGTTDEGIYPSAHQSVATWALKNGCTGALTETGQNPALVASMGTDVQAYAGCPAGIDVQLWTIDGGPHLPGLLHPAWEESVWSFFSSHAKP